MTTILEEIKCGLQVTKATLKIIAVSTGESELTYDMREQEKYENLFGTYLLIFHSFLSS